jgi:tetratricopeptide (TPR) repeat protein
MSTSQPQPAPQRNGRPPAAVAGEHGPRPSPVTQRAHDEIIEASFDRATAYERLGDFERALEWLDRAAAISGGLPPAYRALRDRCIRAAGLRLRATGRDPHEVDS